MFRTVHAIQIRSHLHDQVALTDNESSSTPDSFQLTEFEQRVSGPLIAHLYRVVHCEYQAREIETCYALDRPVDEDVADLEGTGLLL